MLQPDAARNRQQRLLPELADRQLDAVVIGDPRHVYYLTGHHNFWLHESALVLKADGRSWLVTANSPNQAAAADEVEAYEASRMGTQRLEQPMVVAQRVHDYLTRGTTGLQRIGIDASPLTAMLGLAARDDAWTDIQPALWQLRRQKDPDELALMRQAIACAKAMYERARQVIEPGVPEMLVYRELQAAAVAAAGEPLSPAYLGNDYACGVPGGPPRNGRTARAGELYILDLGPAYRGYFSDTCRAFAVDRKPTDAQLAAWQVVTGVFPIVEQMARPGVRCRDLFDAVNEHYLARRGIDLPHHLGHGVGLQPHEYPHLNPTWDDTLMEGEVFTVEPGLYGDELGGGIRIENQYLVTKDGVENLTPFPTELA